MNEIWKEIEDFEGLYEVSDAGNVRNSRTGYILKAVVVNNHSDYLRVSLCKDGMKYNKYVHILVARAFVNNPDPQVKTDVNHKDEDTFNNRADNLEWMTKAENNNYGTRNERIGKASLGRRYKIRPISQFTLDGEYVATHASIAAAARSVGLCRTVVDNAVTGIQQSAGGYRWKRI